MRKDVEDFITDLISFWHDCSASDSLSVFLGLSDKEYETFIRHCTVPKEYEEKIIKIIEGK